MHIKLVKTCFLSPREGRWASLDIPKSSIFIGGSFKIRFCRLNARRNLIPLSDRIFCSLDGDFESHFSSKINPNVTQEHFDKAKRRSEASKIDFGARKPPSRASKSCPASLQQGFRRLQNGSETDSRPLKTPPKSLPMHSDLFCNCTNQFLR